MKRITRFILLTAAIVALGNVKALAQPLVAATVPTAYTAAKEISIFGDAFTNLAGTNFNVVSGQTTVGSIILVAGKNTLKLTNFDYQSMQLASHINAASMKFLHLDVWTADETSLQITTISPGSPANLEHLVAATPLVLSQWNSIDIPLSSFTGVGLNDIFQLKVVGSGNVAPATKKTIYIENLYFYDNVATPDVLAPTAFTAIKGVVNPDSVELKLNATDNSGAVNYTITYGANSITTGGYSGVLTSFFVTNLNPSTNYSFSITAQDRAGNLAANNPIIITATTPAGRALPASYLLPPVRNANQVISIYGYHLYTPLVGVNLNTADVGKKTDINTYHVDANHIVMKLDSFKFQRFELGATPTTIINASKMDSLHVDIYTANETSIAVKLIMPTAGGNTVALTPIKLNTWNSYNLALTAFGVTTSTLSQFEFLNGSGGKTFFMDNLYLFTAKVISEVSKVSAINGIKCYPNLVKDQMTVRAESLIRQVTISNLLGQSVKTILINSLQGTIDLSALRAGNYFVTFKMANDQQATQKIVKL